MHKMRKILILAVLSMVLNACNEESPLQKLHSNNAFSDMNNAFWSEQHETKTALWQQALAYCKEHDEKPNCGSVMQIFVISNGSTDVPAYGTSGHTLTIPDFK